MSVDYKVIELPGPRVVRLVSTARHRPAVLAELVPENEDMLADLASLEGLTSRRLTTQAALKSVLVRNVAGETFINAAFSYPRPNAMNRFSGPEWGAWYAADATATCIAEVAYHVTRELKYIDNPDRSAEMHWGEVFCFLAGHYADLRGIGAVDCLNPNPEIGYPAGNALAAEVRQKLLNGIVYPSVRFPSGICYAALHPHAVQSVTQGDIVKLRWSAAGDRVV